MRLTGYFPEIRHPHFGSGPPGPRDFIRPADLMHFVGGELDDERYVVQRFVSRSNGDIVAVPAEAPGRKGGRRARGTIVPLKEVEKLRPARDEIIIATGVKRLGSGVQIWGCNAIWPNSNSRRLI